MPDDRDPTADADPATASSSAIGGASTGVSVAAGGSVVTGVAGGSAGGEADPGGAERPLRADAARNRRKIMAAARELFAERGLVSLDEVAAHAGVGVGTVYRRFPSRDDLVDALYLESMDDLRALGQDALDRADAQPWEALVSFLTAYLERHAADRSLSSVLLTDAHGCGGLDRAKSEMAPVVTTLVERCKAEGLVRSDLATSDVPLALLMSISLINATRETAPTIWRRALAMLLESFRPGATPIDEPPLELELIRPTMSAAFARR